jgi:3-oxoacyl-[acyl-carrier protein] reductase
MTRFSDRPVLVTGSTRGIGLAIAERLAKEGAYVGIHGRSSERCEELCNSFRQKGWKAFPAAADFSSPGLAAETVKRFAEDAGGIYGLVNNAGGGKAMPFRALSLEKWRASFSQNLEAAMIASKEAYVLMRKAGTGRIVNIASLSAHGPGKWMGADYAASKAGLVSMTKSLAFEAARLGINVNAISPGMIRTDMTAALDDKTVANLGIPMGRMGTPEEVAAAAAFLLSEDADYMTGQVLHINGGLLI